ncbi:MAG: squalene--hopene cyclase [Desulfobacterales bacterium]|jgi:squalene-hopene/tetraprenyl-beta-curcumene cyclase
MIVRNALERTHRVKTLNNAIEDALQWLDDRQRPEGYWMGTLESNVCIEAEWLLAMFFLGIRDDPKTSRLVRGILDEQRSDGSWEVYYNAPQGDINATVEAYAALRAAGMQPEAAPLKKARHWIFANGGLTKIRVFTRYWLALIGEWSWHKTPNVPPEMIYFPMWFPFNIYNFSAWARGTLLPLSILSARRAVRPLPDDSRLDELFPQGRSAMDYALPKKANGLFWSKFFLTADRLLHAYQKIGLTPTRETAIKACLEWIIRHQEADGTWGGIQPPWIYSIMALGAEGYPISHPVMRKGIAALDTHWSYERQGALHIQACESPVWDTLLTLMAMQECECDYRRSPVMQQAVKWLLQQQVKAPGDWQKKVKEVEPGGWAFEHANLNYPDVDDTAVALIVLRRLIAVSENPKRLLEAIGLAKNWVIAMQSRNGGWAAFDKDNDMFFITKIPFCDFGEALDPPSVDVTSHVVEAFGLLGMDLSHPAVRRAVNFIRSEQEPDGSWFGRWGVNYIYGTAAVLPALKAVGENMTTDYVRKAAEWLLSHQNGDGGWGETCGSYVNDRLCGKGHSTASQTAWALMALIAVGTKEYQNSIERGVYYLISHQRAGTWNEPHYTGTGFPGYRIGAKIDLTTHDLHDRLQQGKELGRAFMINYNLYRHYFPLIALGRARRYLKAVK